MPSYGPCGAVAEEHEDIDGAIWIVGLSAYRMMASGVAKRRCCNSYQGRSSVNEL